MSKSGLSIAFSLILSLLYWLSMVSPASAHLPNRIVQAAPQSSPMTVFVETSSGGKSLFSFSGKRPTNLGINQEKLSICPDTPNCVNSQSSESVHQVEPLTYRSSSAQALADLKSVIQGMPRTKIITETNNYLYVEFKSALMGFVDDVEFYLNEGMDIIHVRSASRLGQSDLGVNRKRVEEIRSKFIELEGKG